MSGRLTVFLALAAFAFAHPAPAAAPGEVGCVEVRTRAPHNPVVRVWYRVPAAYDPAGRTRHPVLVLFGGRNCDGRGEVSGKLGWTHWADSLGVFLVAPTFRDDGYWEPSAWSGAALLEALGRIAETHRVESDRLLYYGYSAGSQAGNLFAAWRPDLCLAWVAHACGVFHTPTPRTAALPGLVTCGDADLARYVIGREFVASARALGAPVVWRSFPNHPHDVPPGSVRLAKAFLRHHLAPGGPGGDFVGDDADGVYWPAGSPQARDVPPDERIPLPSGAVARAWGRPGCGGSALPARTETQSVHGVEMVVRLPAGLRYGSRILVCVGGRDWSGTRTLGAFGLSAWADARGWVLLAPSFRGGRYWKPASGSGRALRAAVSGIFARHGIEERPVFVLGYSAGGQFAALLQAYDPDLVAAWAVYGCGVFPERPAGRGPEGFVMCGEGDADRLRIGREFAYAAREAGRGVVWKVFDGIGHELPPPAVALARAWFAAIDADGGRCAVWGEDDTGRVRPADEIDAEFRNPLHSPEVLRLWRGTPVGRE